MRRKPLFLSILAVFLFLTLILTVLKTVVYTKTKPAGRISGPLPFFPSIQIEMLESCNKNLVEDALKGTSRSLLQTFRPNLIQEAWQSDFLFIDLYSGGYKEVVFSLSLPPDQGMLVILAREKDYYIPLLIQDNLLPLVRLEQLQVSPGHFLLLTKEEHSEKTGAYSEARLIKIWNLEESKLEVVWSENSFWELNWPLSRQKPMDTSPIWRKLTQNFSVTYSASPTPAIIINGYQDLAEAPGPAGTLPAPYDFNSIKNRLIQTEYHWNNNWHRFILKTGLYQAPGHSGRQEVAVLKDLDLYLESLATGEKNLYQVVNRQGEIFQAEKIYVSEN